MTLNFWSYNEPGGSFRGAAARCTKQSEGRYRIVFHALANDADTQRQALVRRLAAKDSSIDIMSMDVVWTAEFAEAGWAKAWPQKWAAKIKDGTLQGPLDTATYQGKLYGAPANSNTQLLWYRKDLVQDPPKTWDDLISTAEKMSKAGKIAIQGAQYEGATVWFNSLEASAGGQILDGPDQVGLPDGPTKQALGVMARLGNSSAAPPTLSSMKEDPARLYFEAGSAAFEINWPYIYASAKDSAPDLVKDIGWAPYPSVKDAGTAGENAPIGGFNWGIGGYTKHPEEAFDAATCMRDEQNQREFAAKGGLPPTLASLYDDPEFKKQYPFGDLIRQQLAKAAVRPQTPFYADVSRAIYVTVSPPSGVNPDKDVPVLRSRVSDALQSKGLL